jgi:hypothetical protein
MLQDDIVRTRKYWQPVIQAMISAADWGGKYSTEVEPFLNQLEQRDEFLPLGKIFRRIIAGERNSQDLLKDLDPTSALVAGDVLRALGVAVPELTETNAEEDLGPVIEEIFQGVVYACQPSTPLVYSEQMYGVTRRMAEHPKLEPELRALGLVLNQILAGERNLDLKELSPQWTRRVQELLSLLPTSSPQMSDELH